MQRAEHDVEVEPMELAPGLALLFGLATPPVVPKGAPVRRNRIQCDAEDDCRQGEVSRARRAEMVRLVRAAGEGATTKTLAELMGMENSGAMHMLTGLHAHGRVKRTETTLPNGRKQVLWSAK